MIAKSIFIEGTGCKFGGCVRKAVEITSGDLPFVSESRLNSEITAGRLRILPKGFQRLISGRNGAIPSARWAADYISGLTGRELLHTYRRPLAPS